MAMSEDDKKEMSSLLSTAVAEGLALFRSKVEEEEAKNQEGKEGNSSGNGNSGNGETKRRGIAGFLLGDD